MEQSYLRILFSSLIAIVAMQGDPVLAQNLPQVVLCITVDQLNNNMLDELKPFISQGGFKEIMTRGLFFPQVQFPYALANNTNSTCSIHTGLLPRTHRITDNEYIDPRTGFKRKTFEDKHVSGIYTQATLSPKALNVLTIADRLKLEHGDDCLVYSLANHSSEAIIAGGQMADAVFWIDNKYGTWASSSYYPATPNFISEYNNSTESLNTRLIRGREEWKPLDQSLLAGRELGLKQRTFSHRYNSQNLEAFKYSALSNQEQSELAVRCIQHFKNSLGKKNLFLGLNFSNVPNDSEKCSLENIDLFLRLDLELSKILKTLDREVGLKNCLIVLSGTGYIETSIAPESKAYNKLDTDKSKGLLNMYLSAYYGSASWIQSMSNGEVHLNKKLINSKHLDEKELAQKTAQFLQQIKGIELATDKELLLTQASHDKKLLELGNSINTNQLADVYYLPLPNWDIFPKRKNPKLAKRTIAVPTPLIIYQKGVKFEPEQFPIYDVRDIAPSVCQILRIRPPN